MTPADVFKDIHTRISADPERTKTEIDGTFKFVVTGQGSGTWIVDCREVDVRQGDSGADVTITVDGDDLVSIAQGSLDAMQAFMMGKVQVEGDMGLAMKLQQVL